MLNASDVRLTLTLDPYRERGMFLGSGGIVFFDQTACVIDMCKYFLAFCEDESCGRCTTCHGGTQRAVEILRRIEQGGGRDTDIEKLEGLVQTLVWSNCLHGQFAMTSIKTALKGFRDEFDEHIEQKRCRAGVCTGLIEYRVRSQSDPGLPAAEEICPTGAVQREGGQYLIVDQLCIRCGACKEQAPDAIDVSPRFTADVPLAAVPAAG
jgi:hypothetical protein